MIKFLLAFLAASACAAQDAPISFRGDLSATEMVVPITSRGSGRIDFVLDRTTLNFSWVMTYADLTSPPTAAHIHAPGRPGEVAAVSIDLAPQGVTNPLKGEVTLSTGQLEYLLTGRLYVDLHTEKHPDGEIRAQVERVRPKSTQ